MASARIRLAPLVLLAACDAGADSSPPSPSPGRLRADGVAIVDAQGDEVRFRGVALGGWLFHENWITAVDYPAHARLHVIGEERGVAAEVDEALRGVGPDEKGGAEWLAAFATALRGTLDAAEVDAILAEFAQVPPIVDDSDLPLRRVLEARFGVEGRDVLLDQFHGAWVTRDDVQWIAEHGFNMVRIPMGWRALTSQSDLEAPSALVWNEAAFARLDQVLAWCAEAGLWAVLDVQEAPGGQNEYTGEPSTLYTDPAMQALTVELWEELSRRYADHDEVAAYSLLAEPMSAPDDDARDTMYDTLVRAIRARGDDHLLVVHDGFRGMQTLPHPADFGWEDVVYSTHLFEWSAEDAGDYAAVMELYGTLFERAQAEQGVPYYVGSFSTFVDADWAYTGAETMVEGFDAHGWGWTVWTYKRIDDPIEAALYGTSTAWGVRGRLVGALDRPDLYRDEQAVLAEKFAAYAELDVGANDALLDALGAGGTD